MSEPARGLQNDRAADGTIICPHCKTAIALDAPVIFRDDYALHVQCADKVEEDAKAM
jgi:hypothetical protein